MQLIAHKPLYLGRGYRIQPGESFEVADKSIAQDFINSGTAGIAPPANHVMHSGVAGMVSCIMPTKNRRQFVPRAIACFLAQTYENRELVVLDNGDSIADLVPKDPRIRYVRMASNQTTGQLRNLCCQIARGEFIAHWDDDDWSHPKRLEEQVPAIDGHQVTGYRSMLFHDAAKGKVLRYAGAAKYALGTSLLYRREWWAGNKFPPHKVGEDTEFVMRAAKVINTVDGIARMVAGNHATNTSPRMEKSSEWTKAEIIDLPEGY